MCSFPKNVFREFVLNELKWSKEVRRSQDQCFGPLHIPFHFCFPLSLSLGPPFQSLVSPSTLTIWWDWRQLGVRQVPHEENQSKKSSLKCTKYDRSDIRLTRFPWRESSEETLLKKLYKKISRMEEHESIDWKGSSRTGKTNEKIKYSNVHQHDILEHHGWRVYPKSFWSGGKNWFRSQDVLWLLNSCTGSNKTMRNSFKMKEKIIFNPAFYIYPSYQTNVKMKTVSHMPGLKILLPIHHFLGSS